MWTDRRGACRRAVRTRRRGRSVDAQLRRFLGSADRRKLRYARLLVEALDPDQAPRPLAGVLAHV